MRKRIVPIALTPLLLLAAAGAGPVSPASAAKTYTVCVKKSTGEMRMLLGKKKTKCKKGWKKQTWTKAGPKGSAGGTGPANSLGNLVDATGAAVGQVLQVIPSREFPVFVVRIDGAVYAYASGGQLMETFAEVRYDNSACSGTLFYVAGSELVKDALLADASSRIVIRAMSPDWGPASAYRFSGTATDIVNLPTWEKAPDGSCVATGNATGARLDLTQVPAPPDRPGPLRVS